MLSMNSVRKAPGVRSVLAVACGLVCVSAQMALMVDAVHAEEALEPVVVTATRMPQLLKTAPIGATIITSDQIQRSGASDANEAIRKLAGVASRKDLASGREDKLDLRGFGETAWSNLVVMVDGVRLNENELSSPRITSIPVDQIDRIEIIRGGSSVLWGAGATAGVVNILLKQGARGPAVGKVSASVASFGGQDLTLSGSGQVGIYSVDGAARRVRSEGYRLHSRFKQDSGDLAIAWGGDDWRQRIGAQVDTSAAMYPGDLTYAQFAEDPKAIGFADESRVSETRLTSQTSVGGQAARFGLDLSTRRRVSDFSWASQVVDDHQASPKFTSVLSTGGVEWHTIIGADFQRWNLNTLNGGSKFGEQKNAALYAKESISSSTGTRLDVGLRRERFAQSYRLQDERIAYLTAAELGISQSLGSSWTAYGRLARSYRLVNLDEANSTENQELLKPQTSHDKELGIRWTQGGATLEARLFRQDSRNEIQYVPGQLNGQSKNRNADPTRRDGLELEGRAMLAPGVTMRANAQRVRASYKEGPFAGKQVTLVSPKTATLRLTWDVNAQHSMEGGVQYRSKSRIGDDFSNSCSRQIPASTQLDAAYHWKSEAWQVQVAGTNLTNQVRFSYAYSCATGGLYPDTGRALRLTVSRQF